MSQNEYMKHQPKRVRVGRETFEIESRVQIGGTAYLVVQKAISRNRGRYTVLQRLGRVYRKRVIHTMANCPENRKRIRNLDRATGTNLPTPRILNFDVSNRELCVVTEWLDGQSLRSYLNQIKDCKRPAFSTYEATRLFKSLVHQVVLLKQKLGIIHGDISPENLILSPNNHRLSLIDFGSSFRFTETIKRDEGDGTKPMYRAPELYQGKAASITSEQFSCGVVLFEMLTGRIPYLEIGGAVEQTVRQDETICLELVSDLHHFETGLPAATINLVDEYFADILALCPGNRFASAKAWQKASFQMHDATKYDAIDSAPNLPLVRLANILRRWWPN